MVTDAICGDHYIHNIELLCPAPETNIMLHVNYSVI